MINFIYGFAAGILFMIILVILMMVYVKKRETWDASKDNFNEELMGFRRKTAQYQGSHLKEMESQTLTWRDILEELKKFNKEFCEPIEIDDIPDKIKSLQSLYDDQKGDK